MAPHIQSSGAPEIQCKYKNITVSQCHVWYNTKLKNEFCVTVCDTIGSWIDTCVCSWGMLTQIVWCHVWVILSLSVYSTCCFWHFQARQLCTTVKKLVWRTPQWVRQTVNIRYYSTQHVLILTFTSHSHVKARFQLAALSRHMVRPHTHEARHAWQMATQTDTHT